MHTALRLGLEIAAAVRQRPSERARLPVRALRVAPRPRAARRSRRLGDRRRIRAGAGRARRLGFRTRRSVARRASPGLAADGAREARAAGARASRVRAPRTATGLPPLERYARLIGPEPGQTELVGLRRSQPRLQASLPALSGRARLRRPFLRRAGDVVLADVAQQVVGGRAPLTFGDPDFLNAPGHALRIRSRGCTRRIPTSPSTHHQDRAFAAPTRPFAELRELGCLFVVSALESLSDRVLEELDKGHTRADIFERSSVLRAARIALRPSFVPFTPWTTLDDYLELVDFVFGEASRRQRRSDSARDSLLVPPGSALLWSHGGVRHRAGSAAELAAAGTLPIETPEWLGPYDPVALGYRWKHADPRMDRLFQDVTREVELGAREGSDHAAVVGGVRALAYAAAGRPAPPPLRHRPEEFVPRLTESWFCCAEPSAEQMARLGGSLCSSSTSCGPKE